MVDRPLHAPKLPFTKQTSIKDYSTIPMFYFLLYIISQTVLLAAWVSGALDSYQKRLQEILLDWMGETKVSYGLKSE